MTPLTFGKNGQIAFENENEFYEALGFLCKNDRTTSIHWESNELSGAWGSEGRIHCLKDLSKFPSYFSSAFTAGTGGILKRINCNEYIEYISSKHCIVLGDTQDLSLVKKTIPNQFRSDFNRGLAL